MKKSKKFLSFLLALIMILGAESIGFSGMLSLKAGAVTQDPTALNGMLRVDENGDFKILQIADVQENYFFTYRSPDTIKLAVAEYKPDLIVLTGDNINGTRWAADFDESVKELVACFGGVPFAVTYGNHDIEENCDQNSRDAAHCFSYKYQQEVYDKYGAVKLLQDGLTITDESDYSTSKYGTGYIDIYNHAGTAVVERVIILNSGTYELPADYATDGNVIGNNNSLSYTADEHYGRVGVNAKTFKNTDYENVAAAVDEWTSDSSIKCIAYQHIPVQEIYPVASIGITSSPLVADANGRAGGDKFWEYAKGSYKYSPASGTTGDYNEQSGCSGFSTAALFDALAKPNVAGLFFGHDHVNSLTGVSVKNNGTQLKLGYGGGIELYRYKWTGDSYYYYAKNMQGIDQCSPRASVYTLNSSGNMTKTDTSYYTLLRDYEVADYSGGVQTYISDIRLFAADTAGAGHFSEAVAKCRAAGFTPILEANGSNNGVGTVEADLNLYSYAGYANAKAVCLGYKTSTDVNEAITDIKFYDGATSDRDKVMGFETWDWQFIDGVSTPGADGNISYTNADHTSTMVSVNEGCDATQIWLFYKKANDSDGIGTKVGRPIKKLFLDINNEKASGGFNPNSFTREDPYSFACNLVKAKDVDVEMNFGAGGTGNNYNIKNNNGFCSAHLGMVYAMPEDTMISVTPGTYNATKPTAPTPVAHPGERPADPSGVKTPTIVVPDTIYLTPGGTSFQYYMNNNSNGSAKTDTSPETTGYYYFSGGTLNSVTLEGATLNQTNKTITGGTCTGLGSGESKTIKWTFTYDTDKTAYAYTTVYAPYQYPVFAATRCNVERTLTTDLQSMAWISGVHDVGTGGNRGVQTAAFLPIKDVLSFTAGSNTSQDTTTYHSESNSPKTGTFYNCNDSGTNATYGTQAVSPAGVITVDRSRNTNFNTIPNFEIGYLISYSSVETPGGTGSKTYRQFGGYISDYSSYYSGKVTATGATNYYDDASYPKGDIIASDTSKENQSSWGNDSDIKSRKIYDSTWNKSVPESNTTIAIKGGGKLGSSGSSNFLEGKGSNTATNSNIVLLDVKVVNKSSLRSTVKEAATLYEKAAYVNGSYTYGGTTYTINAATLADNIEAAALALGNPASQTTSSTLSTYCNAVEAAFAEKVSIYNDYQGHIDAYNNYINVTYPAYQAELAAYNDLRPANSGTATVSYKLNGNVVASALAGYRYSNSGDRDTVTAYPGNFNGYTAQANQTWSANATSKAFEFTYTPNNYQITFNVNGGNALSAKTYDVEDTGSDCIVLPTPTFTGHTFKGWKVTSANNGCNWLVNTVYEPGSKTGYKYGNVTLEAQWQINKSSLTVNPNGGTYNGTTANTIYTDKEYNSTQSVADPTVGAEQVFTGWEFVGSQNGSLSGQTYTFGPADKASDTIRAIIVNAPFRPASGSTTSNTVTVGYAASDTLPASISGITARDIAQGGFSPVPTWNEKVTQDVKVTNTYSGGTKDITSNVKFYPETNVLYEETAGTATNGTASWSTVSGTKGSAGNSSAKLYGYTNAYANDNIYSNGSAYEVTVAEGQTSWPTYTFTFSGTAFDINTRCDTDTGLMTVKVYPAGNHSAPATLKDGKKASKAINTVFLDGKTLYQTPTVHLEMQSYGTYDVVVSVAYSQAFDPFYDNGNAGGAADENEVEFTKKNGDVFVDLSDLLGEGYEECEYEELAPITETKSSAVDLFDMSGSLAGAGADTKNSYKVCIDSIRVYNPAGTNLTSGDIHDQYDADNELNPTYSLMRNLLLDKTASAENLSGITGIVYIEKNAIDETPETTLATSTYIKKGSGNEIYLTSGNGIGFTIDKSNLDALHIALRSPTGEPAEVVVGTGSKLKTITLNTATEMYYDVRDYLDSDGNLAITVNSGMVAIGSCKTIGASSPTLYASAAALETAAELVCEVEENPLEIENTLTFDVNFGDEATATVTFTEENFNYVLTDGKWVITVDLTAEEIAELFADSGLSDEYTLGKLADTALVAELVDGEWVTKDATFFIEEVNSAEPGAAAQEALTVFNWLCELMKLLRTLFTETFGKIVIVA